MLAESLASLDRRVSDWVAVGADRVRGFADTTEDWQFIHLDPERAAETPFGGAIAHGFLTLSLLAPMSDSALVGVFPEAAQRVNYGFDHIRFVAPVPVGARLRAVFLVAEVEEGEGWIDVHWDVTVEIEGANRPALVAQWIVRVYLVGESEGERNEDE
ncbi:MaoC family dehydratase [Allosediminivita pacifica]|uniref:Acyl dehydratase n=1 Tax=Allosediminivita pacifica TaxID=1267769 RepID=A0A2T6BA60_9RHOB|nr:MaoC family dehydratase [Allosediminivita pacifica]PTX52949.1 acyl dehydratase [Allosediminivita pacifica]GGA94282.1 nodulation protein [Allosediminivita pacifica]